MLLLALAAVASAGCPSAANPLQILASYQAAVAPIARAGAASMTASYAYQGQGLTGVASSTVDLRDGRFVDQTDFGPNKGASGFDGQNAWMRDLSGVTSAQGGGDKPALARNEAYRNANLWFRPDRGGAAIESIGCDRLRVTPRGGKSFEARFDPVTHLLAAVREDQSFGVVTTTEYSAYERRGGHLLPTRIATLTGDDPASRETLSLTRVTFSATPSQAAFRIPPAVATNWSMPPAGRVTLPFRLINNHVVVDVRINGKGPFPFLVDTGGHDIVTPATLKALGLASQGASPSFGAGDKAGSNGYAHVDRIDAGGAVLRDQTVITLDFSPPDVEGLQVGGMLGVEFIERFVVRIDYGAKTMTLIDPRRFGTAERRAAGLAVPFVFYDHMPQVAGKVDGRPARLDIDTGSRAEVTMTTPYVARAKLRAAYPDGVSITDGWGVGGPSHSYVVRLRSMTLGGSAVPDVIAGFSSAKVGAFADAGSDGNVGSGFLKRYAVTFDYRTKTLFLKPLDHPDPDTGRFDRVGLWVNAAQDGLQVMDVAPGGPAATAGLKIGDTVTSLGGRTINGRELSDIRRQLKLVEVGKTLEIDFLRAGHAGSATVIPRDLVPDRAARPRGA